METILNFEDVSYHYLDGSSNVSILNKANYSFEKGKLSSGYRISNTAISNDLVNLLGTSHYDVNYLEQYLYTEYSGKFVGVCEN